MMGSLGNLFSTGDRYPRQHDRHSIASPLPALSVNAITARSNLDLNRLAVELSYASNLSAAMDPQPPFTVATPVQSGRLQTRCSNTYNHYNYVMKRPKLSRKARQKLALMRIAANRRASFERDMASNKAGISKLSSNGGIVCRSYPTVGISAPPTKSKFTPDDRGRWHFNPEA